MTVFSNSIDIEAPKETVFQSICDLQHYPEWHPSMKNISGSLGLNKTLVLHMGKKDKKGVKIPVVVTVLEENNKLEWQGSLFKGGALRKYFLVRHSFSVEDIGNGKTRFTNEEAFYGVLSFPVSLLQASFISGYKEVNQALKTFVEARKA